MKCKQVDIYGKAGKVFCFHGLNLHGTSLNFSRTPRISLRYLIQSDNKHAIKSCLGKSFKLIKGKILESKKLKNGINFQRLDRASDGRFLKTGSSILKKWKLNTLPIRWYLSVERRCPSYVIHG